MTRQVLFLSAKCQGAWVVAVELPADAELPERLTLSDYRPEPSAIVLPWRHPAQACRVRDFVRLDAQTYEEVAGP